MKFKNPTIFLIIIFNIVNVIKSQGTSPQLGTDYPGIKCGKDKPKKEADCTKYGTDSEMLCCYVKYNNGSVGCTLFYDKRARALGIGGAQTTHTFDNGEYWSCGNKSFYLSINLFIILISIFLY